MGKAVGTPVLSGLMLGSQTPPFPPGSLLHGQRRCHTGAQGLLPHQISRVPEFARAEKGGVGSKTALASCWTEKGCEDLKVLTLGKPGLHYGPRKKALYLLWASSTHRKWEVKLAHRVVWRALPRNPAPLCTGWAPPSW